MCRWHSLEFSKQQRTIQANVLISALIINAIVKLTLVSWANGVRGVSATTTQHFTYIFVYSSNFFFIFIRLALASFQTKQNQRRNKKKTNIFRLIYFVSQTRLAALGCDDSSTRLMCKRANGTFARQNARFPIKIQKNDSAYNVLLDGTAYFWSLFFAHSISFSAAWFHIGVTPPWTDGLSKVFFVRVPHLSKKNNAHLSCSSSSFIRFSVRWIKKFVFYFKISINLVFFLLKNF